MKILMLYYDTSVLRQEVNSTLILVFFLPFVFFVYFIMVTMFIALIIDAYRATSEASVLNGREMEASDYFGQVVYEGSKSASLLVTSSRAFIQSATFVI